MILRLWAISPGLGASSFAIHSRRHSSCAVREHGHGVRQVEVSGVSSVSSIWQIQHVRGSGLGSSLEDCGSVVWEAEEAVWGLFRRKDCDSAEEDEGVLE